MPLAPPGAVLTGEKGSEQLRGSNGLSGPLIALTVYGEARPAGSKRAFQHPHTGKVIVTEDSKGSRSWQNDVRTAARDAYEGELLDGPLAVTMTFYRPRPRGHFGSGRNAAKVRPSAPEHAITRPDLLKVARGVEDALTGTLWRDDSQIVREVLEKCYGEPARLELEVRPL